MPIYIDEKGIGNDSVTVSWRLLGVIAVGTFLSTCAYLDSGHMGELRPGAPEGARLRQKEDGYGGVGLTFAAVPQNVLTHRPENVWRPTRQEATTNVKAAKPCTAQQLRQGQYSGFPWDPKC
jgi:hypothetical protein